MQVAQLVLILWQLLLGWRKFPHRLSSWQYLQWELGSRCRGQASHPCVPPLGSSTSFRRTSGHGQRSRNAKQGRFAATPPTKYCAWRARPAHKLCDFALV